MRHANALCGKIPNITHKTNPFSIENLNTFLKNNGSDTVKTPIGLFDSEHIDNDLLAVDKAITEYYELKKAA